MFAILLCMCLDNTCVSLDNANYDTELDFVSNSQKTFENIEKNARCLFVKSLVQPFVQSFVCNLALCMRLSHAHQTLSITPTLHLSLFHSSKEKVELKKKIKFFYHFLSISCLCFPLLLAALFFFSSALLLFLQSHLF